MKTRIIIAMIFVTIISAYITAQSKISHQPNLKALRLGMSVQKLEEYFGSATGEDRNLLTYIFDDSSELVVTLRDDLVASAIIKFHKPLKIEDPKLRELTLVQMESSQFNDGRPSWFFAGKPQEGLIYKITADGTIESLTWVPPFSYSNSHPKHLHALLEDFQNQNIENL